jgi:hypothetical protein
MCTPSQYPSFYNNAASVKHTAMLLHEEPGHGTTRAPDRDTFVTASPVSRRPTAPRRTAGSTASLWPRWGTPRAMSLMPCPRRASPPPGAGPAAPTCRTSDATRCRFSSSIGTPLDRRTPIKWHSLCLTNEHKTPRQSACPADQVAGALRDPTCPGLYKGCELTSPKSIDRKLSIQLKPMTKLQ